MFIQTEPTPNPLTMKFIPGVPVMPSGTAFFTDPSQAMDAPLALSLFTIEGVEAVFLAADFVTVTKDDESHWEALKPIVLTTLMDHLVAGKPVVTDSEKPSATSDGSEDSELVKQIKELIETRVRPAVAQDGGDIIFHSYKDGIVQLELHGSCSGCPSSTITLKNGIENMLKHYVPEVVAVEAV
jgi:Fe-S cluster biogenesis protein NfuA